MIKVKRSKNAKSAIFAINKKMRPATNDALKLQTTASGHYKMPICHMVRQECNVTLNTERLLGATVKEKQQKAL